MRKCFQMEEIKNIIFDFGGVILNIDFSQTMDAFKKLGIQNPEELYSMTKQAELFAAMEKGEIDEEAFFNELRRLAGKDISNVELRRAWNALLLDWPRFRLILLENVKKKYRIFLLSNTNKIHYDKYAADLEQNYDSSFEQLFEKAYFSFNHGMIKPDKSFYELVLKENNLNPFETLYIDDNDINLPSAEILGINTYHLTDGEDVIELFDDEFNLILE